MPTTGKNFIRSTAIFLLVGLLALIGIVGTTIWLVEQSRIDFDKGLEARVARAATINLRNGLQNAETGQRGFLLTNKESYLEPYNAATPQVPAMVDRLAEVLKPYPEADQAMAALRAGVADKMAELAETIVLQRGGNAQDALALVETDRGKKAMDEANSLFDGILKSADETIVASTEHQRNSTIALRWVTIVGAFVILGVVGNAVLIALRYMRELAAARELIAAANRELEERVRERTADLGKANEEIQRFAYIVTHDLRAPLVNIMGFTSELQTSMGTLQTYISKRPDDGTPELAEARLAAAEDLPEAIGFIRSSTKKMDALINAILKISRAGRRTLRPETVVLGDIVDASIASVQHQITEGGGSASADIKVPSMISDKLSLEQILGNLLDNAVKYQQPGRPLELAITARPAKGDHIVIDVKDNGRGIAATDHERVFELFRRSGTQSAPGEGIGLAHVRSMVRGLGGEIAVVSELGSGTTFTVNLPRDLRSFVGSHPE